MLIHDSICMELPADRVAALVESGHEWLAPLAVSAYREGEYLVVRAGPAENCPLAKRVRLTMGRPRNRGKSLLVPVHWEATGLTGLFPMLDADLEFVPLGAGGTQLNLWGTYDPPMDGVGHRLDRLVFHRVAEATVRAFLQKLAAAILDTAGRRSEVENAV